MFAPRFKKDELPDPPDELVPLWIAFCDLHAARSVGFEQNPITYAEIEAYSRSVAVPLLPWMVRALRLLDDAVLAAIKRKGKRKAGSTDDKAQGSRTIINERDPEGVRSMLRGMRPMRGSRAKRVGARG